MHENAVQLAAFGKMTAVYGQISKNGTLPVKLNEILAGTVVRYRC